MPYTRMCYHIIWATRRREPWLVGDSAHVVEAAIRSRVTMLHGYTHGVGVMPDHVHVVCAIPPTIAVAEAIGQLKGRSSHLVRERHPDLADAGFSWQSEYGLLTFGDRSLQQLLAYVANQAEHHDLGTLIAALERDSDVGVQEVREGAKSGGTRR